jgi:hypothetical protein
MWGMNRKAGRKEGQRRFGVSKSQKPSYPSFFLFSSEGVKG